ncbi:MAG: phospho-sugar mutase [Kofleriaceae bacterium]|nr:phospho-sugar mutase [Kofleriaceae bacterium]
MSVALAQEWLAQDPDSETRAELQTLLDDPSRAEELVERFNGSLEFGTAGLRGVLGCGPQRMNRVLVQKVSAGLADTMLKQIDRAQERGIVIGYDGRHKSRIFAEDTAAVFLGKGFRVYLSTVVVPTPVVAFGVLDYGAAGGVMVTASHNPPEYNGYKVYWENGAQIIPPQDKDIATSIEAVSTISDLTLGSIEHARTDGMLVDLDETLISRYMDGVSKLSIHKGILEKVPLRVAYTPMHGVGAPFVREALKRVGLVDLHIEPSQEEPDGDFPTVNFPNPEEEGAMDLVFALAKKVKADLVLANDPDADRLAVALPVEGGEYRMLSGDQIGVLLADYLLSTGTGDKNRLLATTLVSSQLLGIMAESHGISYQTTLTGFKWIANAAIDALAKNDTQFVMGYEEALGYSVGDLVRDKDGVSAVMLFCELAAFAKSESSTVLERLDALYRKHGVFSTAQESLVLPGADGAAQIQAYLKKFRDRPPAEIGGFKVERSYDLLHGAMDLPPSNVLVYFLEGNRRVIMRPSGTEPKLKCYYEVCEPVDSDEPVAAAVTRAQSALAMLSKAHQAMLG